MPRWGLAVVYGLPILVIALLAIVTLRAGGAPQDEGALLVYADRVLHGAVAHRDFATYYGPGMPWVLAGAFLFAGHQVIVERLVGMTLEWLLVVGMTAMGLRFGRAAGLLAGVLSAVAIGAVGVPVASPWLAALALGLLSLVVATSPGSPRWRSTWRYALAGVLGALALIFRIDFAMVAGLSIIPVLVARRRAAWCYLGGAAVGLLPLAVHVAIASPARVFNLVVVDGLFDTSAARRLPLPPGDSAARVQLMLLLVSAAISVLAAALAWRRSPRTERTRLLGAATLLVLAILPETLQRADTAHLLPAMSVSVGLLAVSAQVVAAHLRWRLTPARTTLARGVCIALTLLATAPGIEQAPSVSVSNGHRSFPLTPVDAPGPAQTVLAYVDRITRPGQRLFVGPLDMRRTNSTATYLYFLLPQLSPATYYLEMEPMVGNGPGSQLAANVASADVLLLTSEWDHWSEANQSASFYGSDLPNAVVRTSFCLRLHDGVFWVYTRCGTAA
ncbi:MAG: hypothetical protein ACRENL_07450 [Candidatus Dormibacteria bacterium]